MEVNFAVCHRPKGIAPHRLDMRFNSDDEEPRLTAPPARENWSARQPID